MKIAKEMKYIIKKLWNRDMFLLPLLFTAATIWISIIYIIPDIPCWLKSIMIIVIIAAIPLTIINIDPDSEEKPDWVFESMKAMIDNEIEKENVKYGTSSLNNNNKKNRSWK